MTAQRASAKPKVATQKQLRLLRELWNELGKTGELPKTRRGAFDAIQAALRKRRSQPTTLIERARQRERPTNGQAHDLAVLARRAGEPTPTPRDAGEAVRELQRLKEGKPKVP